MDVKDLRSIWEQSNTGISWTSLSPRWKIRIYSFGKILEKKVRRELYYSILTSLKTSNTVEEPYEEE